VKLFSVAVVGGWGWDGGGWGEEVSFGFGFGLWVVSGVLISVVAAACGTVGMSTVDCLGIAISVFSALGTMIPALGGASGPPAIIMAATTAASAPEVPSTAQLNLRLTKSPPSLLLRLGVTQMAGSMVKQSCAQGITPR
jgi:hypothetical protein